MDQETQSASSTAETSATPLARLAVAFSFLIGGYKAFVWSHGNLDGQVVGYAVGSATFPVLIAYAIAGRKKVMGRGYAFAAWVSGLSVLFLLIEISNSRH
jgi:hypothetical protein